jgi:prepilin-type N-terminal cleavage/methylation domain-containing protein
MTGSVARRGFSLIELVIVVVIIGIIAAIAVPRMSRGSAGAADASLQANLSMLRKAIDLFQSEHPSATNNGLPTAANIVNQLTQFSDEAGATSATRSATHVFGPYLRAIPPLPVGARRGGTLIDDSDGANVGWLYVESTGAIRANTTTETDARGVLYSSY